MKIPAITGSIRRRILLNYRVAPEVVQAILPANLSPKLVKGHAIAGICLIRLEEIRPKGMPVAIGFSSENSAHRIAVEWEDATNGSREGVFVPRRDTDSRFNAVVGGRAFPGVHHHSRFTVHDLDGRISLKVEADDLEKPLVELELEEEDGLPDGSVFESLEQSSQFFESGCVGYSPSADYKHLEGLLLEVKDWRVEPLKVQSARSAYFDDRSVFPPGSIELDHALLMRDIPHVWRSEPNLMLKTRPRGNGSGCPSGRGG
ncbi:MAG: DUF2071 domain-containing protein [Verrucomicrobiota bacterium]